jgi:hypothetical protein
MRTKLFHVVLFSVLLFSLAAWCQVPPPASDSAAIWQALQRPAFAGGKSASVSNVTIERDRIKITLTSGTIQFAPPVNGIVFAGVFRGMGRLQITPPNPIEAQQLNFFLKKEEIDTPISEATFTFTDKTFEDIAAQVKWADTSSGELGGLWGERQQQRESVGFGVVPRLFKSILSTDRAKAALFLADLKTPDKGWLNVSDDALDEEEIGVAHYQNKGPGGALETDTWMSFPGGGRSSSDAYADPFAKEDYHIHGYQIDASVTRGAELGATTKVKLESRLAGERVWIFELNSNLRVDKILDDQGKPLEFYQPRERKDNLTSFGEWLAVVFPAPTEKNAVRTLEFHYAGKRVIRQEGPGNYFCPSSGWYPQKRNSFASRADFELTFHSPKGFTLIATGDKTGETLDGNTLITTWKSGIPLAVAGFAYGDYKVITEKAGNVEVDIYANREPDDIMNMIQRSAVAVGNMSPAMMAKPMASEFANAVRVFENYFGPYPYKRLAVTSLPVSFTYGQGWPGLIYLWSASFLDDQQRHQIGLRDNIELTDFFRAHETSHMWWGHRVGWKSYHDQWMSEGFAQFSGNLYIQYRESMKEYVNRIKLDRQALTQSDAFGHRYESVGPVWMGLRLISPESPRAYQTVIYKKGGLILHMLRMMLYDPRGQDPDKRFKEMMQDFCKTFDNKAASTEDFKAIVEKHIINAMDVEKNHRMDWFFRQYVYGTGIPRYEFRYEIKAEGEGQWRISGKVTRSGVPDNWIDILPIYIHQGNVTGRLGFVNATQPTAEFNVALKFKPDKLSLNDFEDMLAEIKQ